MGELEGQVALITGAARGQGRSHAVTFAEHGADLVLLDICRDLERAHYPMGTRAQLEETASRCRELGRRVLAVECDVRLPDEVDAVVEQGVADLGRVDALINNAGTTSPAGSVLDLEPADWREVVAVDLDGPYHCARAVARHMVDRGGGGCIVNISSAAGLRAYGSNAAYVAAKHGVIGLTRSMAVDLAEHGIRVNAICPGTVRDDPELDGHMLHGLAKEWGVAPEDIDEAFSLYHLLPGLIEARDISLACAWLASDAGVRVTGAAIPVDAGSITK